MGSKGRLPPPHHLRRPPGPGYHDPVPPEMHPHHGGFPSYDMPPRPEIMEQKLAAQHAEMQKLATENQRFAATHGTLRQDLAAIQHELQMLHNHVAGVKSEREQQIMGLLDKIGKMEADLKGAEPLKMELHKARADAQSLFAAREELVAKVQQVSVDHQRVHMELQQIPALMSELETLRQEYQHCRATFEYEKKLYNDHLESLQVMEKNYMNMASEVEKLRAELKKHAENEKKTASTHYPVGQNTYDESYALPQGWAPLPGVADGSTAAGYDVYRGPGSAVPSYGGPGAPAYDPQRVPGATAYDPQWGPGAPTYVAPRGPNPHGYIPYRGPGVTGYDKQRGPGGPPRGPQFSGPGSFTSPTGTSGPQGQAMLLQANNPGGGFQGAQVQPPPPQPADGGSHPGRK